LDEEPTRRQRWRQLVWPAAGVLAACIVGGGIAAGVLLSGGGSAAPVAKKGPPPLRPDGRVLYTDPSDTLTLADPEGHHVETLSKRIKLPSGGTVSADGKNLLAAGGQVSVLRHGRPGPFALVTPHDLQGSGQTARFPWADHARAVVFLADNPTTGSVPIALVDLGSGKESALGIGVSAAGDPTGRRALVVTAGGKAVTEGNVPVIPAGGIDLRSADGSSHTVITAQDWASDLGLNPNLGYELHARFSPHGRYVLVSGDRVQHGSVGQGGIVVLTRTGRTVLKTTVPTAGDAFSPDGNKLEYGVRPAHGSRYLVVALLSGSGPHRKRVKLPASTGYAGNCLWSPEGRYLLCTAGRPGWVLLDPKTGRSHLVARSAHTLLGWFPAQGGQQ
jgi:hypothetical protein